MAHARQGGPLYLPHVSALLDLVTVVLETEHLARAFGPDDEKSPRTPSGVDDNAGPQSAPRLIAFQIAFFVLVTLTEHKWVTLAERRGWVPLESLRDCTLTA